MALNIDYIMQMKRELEEKDRLATEAAIQGDRVAQLPIEKLVDFPAEKHRFRAATGQRLEELEDSIRAYGIINPLIVRPMADDTWQIITGHNRRTAARNVGYTTVPAIVKRFADEDEALGVLTTDNLRNRELLPSERGWAYRDLMEIQMKRKDHLPGRPYSNSSQSGTNYRADESVGAEFGDSKNKVRRYIRLTYLIPELLNLVDEGKLGLGVGEQLSYLKQRSQETVYLFCYATDKPRKISESQARAIREAENDPDQIIDEDFLEDLLAPKKKIRFRTLKLEMSQLRQYFPTGTPEEVVVQTIHSALTAYFEGAEN